MEEPAIFDKFTTISRDIFDEDELLLTPAATADDMDGWDTLSHIRLVLAVSKAFATTFSASAVGGLDNVGEFVALMRTKP